MDAANEHGRDEVARRVRELGTWFHNMDLDGVQTAPDHFLGDYPAFQWRRLEPSLPPDLAGHTVLDIGCNAGYFAIAMKRRGAARVVGIDSDARYLAQAEWGQGPGRGRSARALGLRRRPTRRTFDVVLFMGVSITCVIPCWLDLIHQHVAGDLSLCSRSNGRCGVEESSPIRFEEREVFNRPAYLKLHSSSTATPATPHCWVPTCLHEAMLRMPIHHRGVRQRDLHVPMPPESSRGAATAP
jgi:tRNA (mo5U34)-methyltransferase